MQIDPILLEEVSVLQELAKQTFAETFAHDNDPEELEVFFEEAYSVEVLTRELSDPNCQHYFLRIDDQLAGYLKLNQGSAQTEQELENALKSSVSISCRPIKVAVLGRSCLSLLWKSRAVKL